MAVDTPCEFLAIGEKFGFKGTRVPVRALFENIEGGATVEQFLEWFPGVPREQVLAVLRFAESSLVASVASCPFLA